MAAHRRTLPKRLVLLHKSGGYVVPKAMIPSNMVPAGQVQLTPLGSSQMLSSAPLPENYEANMYNMLNRAQASGINAGGQFQANVIRQRLVQHMNSLQQPSSGWAGYPSNYPSNYPSGRSADSFDRKY